MRHRTFIAINFPEDIKKELLNYQSKWPELPIRWTKEENLHITLIFIGYASDEDTGEICKITKEVVSRYKSFLLNLIKSVTGPPKKCRLGRLNFWKILSLRKVKINRAKNFGGLG